MFFDGQIDIDLSRISFHDYRTMKKAVFLIASALLMSIPLCGEERVTISIGSVSYTLTVAEEHSTAGYSRDEWPHWEKIDDSCLSVRDKVLAEESLVPVTTVVSGGRCRVVSGLWICPYSGTVLTDADDVDVDHLVPLAEAYQSGGYLWDAAKREAYANDVSYSYHLIAVDDSENQAKSDRDPSGYLPRDEFLAMYLEAWLYIKARWNLSVDPAELAVLRSEIGKLWPEIDDSPPSSVSDIPSPPSAGSWAIVFIDAILEQNESVGNEWDTYVVLRESRVVPGTAFDLSEIPEVRIEAIAIERDDGGDDIGTSILLIRSRDYRNGQEFTMRVAVRENGGRYTGNLATWAFRFRILKY